YGIGGGAIMAPFLVSVFGLPVYTVAGAALAGTLVTSVAGVAFYQLLAPYVPHLDVAPVWGIGLLLGIGGLAGTYIGARLQKHLPAALIKWMLVLIIVATATLYLVQGLR
ncbi:MAG: TSUP family transporter, partial [Acidobacteriota bacterium]